MGGNELFPYVSHISLKARAENKEQNDKVRINSHVYFMYARMIYTPIKTGSLTGLSQLSSTKRMSWS